VEQFSVSWDDFERALMDYRDAEFMSRSAVSGENAYLLIFSELAEVPWEDRASHADSLILFLNRWACHFPTKTPNTRLALSSWIAQESETLHALATFRLGDTPLPTWRDEFERLYGSLIDLQSRSDGPSIPTMGPAAASKILHLLVPSLFVMWDREIMKGRGSYGAFMVDMNDLAAHIQVDLAPWKAREDLDGYLQGVLGYPVRKPLAKYIDEYNWWRVWGPGR
jgi:hypothetical protein